MIQATDSRRRTYRLDIVAKDKDDRPVLVVEVKARQEMGGADEQLRHYMEMGDFPFGMVVTLEDISLYQRQSESWPEPVVIMPTTTTLSPYEPNIHEKQIFEFYLSALVAAWLDDLMFHWQSQEPPGAQDLASVGLLPDLVGGSTELETTWP
jgi:hypothetical protein